VERSVSEDAAVGHRVADKPLESVLELLSLDPSQVAPFVPPGADLPTASCATDVDAALADAVTSLAVGASSAPAVADGPGLEDTEGATVVVGPGGQSTHAEDKKKEQKKKKEEKKKKKALFALASTQPTGSPSTSVSSASDAGQADTTTTTTTTAADKDTIVAHYSTIVERLAGCRLGVLRTVFDQLIAAPPHTSAPVVSLAATHPAGPFTRVDTSPDAILNRGSTFVPAKIRDWPSSLSETDPTDPDPTALLMSTIRTWQKGDAFPFEEMRFDCILRGQDIYS
jgi:hypothetical protein